MYPENRPQLQKMVTAALEMGTTVEVAEQNFWLYKSPPDGPRLAKLPVGTLLEVCQVKRVAEDEQWLCGKRRGLIGWFKQGYNQVKALKLYHPDHPEYEIGRLAVHETDKVDVIKERACTVTGLRRDHFIAVIPIHLPNEIRTGQLANVINWQPSTPDTTIKDLGQTDTFPFVYFGDTNSDLLPELQWHDPIYSDDEDEN